MNQLLTYHSLLKGIIYVLLIGQIWTNTAPYFQYIIDSETEFVLLSNAEDNESEEEDNKKEKDDKIRIDTYSFKFEGLVTIISHLHSKSYLSLHHPEINTPPPQINS